MVKAGAVVVVSPRRARTREALLGAGVALFAERPPDAVAIDEIVRAAGVAKGSFFNHFEDKQAFAGAVARGLRAELEGVLFLLNEGIGGPATRVARATCFHLRYACAAPRRARAFVRLCADPFAPPPLTEAFLADLDRVAAAHGLTGRSAAVRLLAGGAVSAAMASVVTAALGPSEARTLGADLVALLLRTLGLAEGEADRIAQLTAAEILSARVVRGAPTDV